jgi:hypothetical protein
MMFDPQSPTMPQPYRTVHPVHAFFISLLGPADSPAHPLIGTKYDPYYQQLRQSESLQRRRARTEQRRQRGVTIADQPFGASITAS